MGETVAAESDAQQGPELEMSPVCPEAGSETGAETGADAGGETSAAGAGVRSCEVLRGGANASWGFHLSRTQWDPYPWVSGVDGGSAAEAAGLLAGDCVLEVNGEDVLGERIGAVAARVRARPDRVSLLLWNAGADPNCTPESLCCGPMPTNLQRLSACVAAVVAALECPVCLEVVAPPAHQCANGHLICVRCRVRSERCPVCRVRFSRGRSLLADHCFQALTDAFNLKSEAEEARPAKLRERLFGHRRKAKPPPAPAPPPKAALAPPVPPTNKFLARLLGRASSVENLSTAGRPPHGAAHAHEFNSLKAKSLSSSDISRPLSPAASRCPSHTALHLPPAHVLSPRSPLALRSRSRPASFHGSCDSLSGRIAADFGERPAAAAVAEGELFVCPRSAGCGERLDTNTVVPHAHERHDGPLVHYARPSALWSLPPPLESATIALAAPDASATAVFVVVERVGDSDGGDGVADGDGQCDAPGWCLWAWAAGARAAAALGARAVVRAGPREASFALPVLSPSRASWGDARRLALRLADHALQQRFPGPPAPLGLLLEITATPNDP